MKRIGALLLCLFVLTACTAEPTEKQEETPEEERKSEVVVQVDLPVITEEISSSAFSFDTSSSDNTEAMKAALDYMKNHPGTRLTIDKGVYRFSPDAPIEWQGLTDCEVCAEGVEFIFDKGNYFYLFDCTRVRVTGLVIDWDWENDRLADVVKVVATGENTVDLEYIEVEDVDENGIIYAFNRMDPDLLTPGGYPNKEYYNIASYVSGVEKIDRNVLRLTYTGILDNLCVGEVYRLRHYTYRSSAFYIAEQSNHITFDGVTLYGVLGAGFVAGGGAHHVQLLHVTVGLRPGTESTRRISTTVDVCHFADTAGYFLLDGCDFSFSGDDCLNIHDNMAYICGTEGNTMTVMTTNVANVMPGNTVRVYSAQSEDTGIVLAPLTVTKTDKDNYYTVTFDSLPEEIGEGCVLANDSRNSGHYIVQNCYFHECRARGLLLQADNGLVQNNRFYRTQAAAVQICIDWCSLWQEGNGVDNLTIRNNTFTDCCVSDWTAVLNVMTNSFDKIIRNGVFTNIVFENNTISGFPSSLLSVSSSNGFVFRNNTVTREKEGTIGVVIKQSQNVTITGNTLSDKLNVFNATDKYEDTITVSDNTKEK